MKNTLQNSLVAGAALIALAAGGLQTARANTNMWVGVAGTSATTNWSDNLNWSIVTGSGSLGPNGNDVVFGNSGAAAIAATVNSVVNQNLLNPLSLTFTNNSTSSKFHTVLFPSGVSLTNANTLTVGKDNGATSSYLTTVGFAGPGTFVQNGNLTVKNNTTATAATAWLDLSGLSNFVMNASAATLTLAGTGADSRGSGRVDLAAGTNNLTVGTINIALGSGNGGNGGALNLGAGTNILNVGAINIAAGKANSGNIKFLSTTGGLRLRGVTGADSDRNVTMVLGNRNAAATGSPNGTMDFTGGHAVDVKAGTITLGTCTSANPPTAQGNSAKLAFDAGTVDVTNVLMAVNSQSFVTTTGNLIVGTGGKLIVNTLSLVNQTAGTGGGNLSFGGTVIVSNSIFKTTAAGTASVTMTNGTLTLVSGATVGSGVNPIDNLTMGDSVLNVSPSPSAAIVANNLTTSGSGNTINISSLSGISSYPKQFPIIAYAGAIAGNGFNYTLGTLPSGSPAYQGYLSNNVTSLTVDFVLTSGPVLLDVWTGVASSLWDLTSLNWTNSGAASVFHQNDPVQLDDSATGSTVISLTTNVSPPSLTVSNVTKAYVLGSTGAVVGAVSLVKSGGSSLTFTNSGTNTFNGGITINAGTVQFGSGSTAGNWPANSQTVSDNGNLVFNLSGNVTVANAITGSGTLAQNGGGVVSLTASNSYSGLTSVKAGTLLVDGYIGGGGGVTNSAGATLGGTNTIIGTVNAVGNLNPGDVNGIGTLAVNGNTTLYSGATGVFDLNAADTTVGNGVNDLLVVTGDLNANNNTLSVNLRGTPQAGNSYTVMTYSGALGGTFNATVGGTHYAANVDTSTANQVNVLITGSSGANEKWASTSSSSWDNTAQNWVNLGTSLADYFYSGDTVLLDDSVANVVTNLVIPTGSTMYPTIISNVSSAKSYSFSGGAIGGAASLVKDGTSTLTISNANTFTGTVDVYNGTLLTANGSALGSASGGTTIYSGATLDVGGQNLGSETVTVSGSGVGGLGAIVNSGVQQINALKNVTLAGDTMFGGASTLTNAGAARWDIRGPSATLQSSGSPVNLTKVGTNQISLVACTCDDINLKNVDIQQGNFSIQSSSTQFGDPNGFIFVRTNAILDVFALTAGLNKNIWLLDGGTLYSESGRTPVAGTVTVTNNVANTAPGTGIVNSATNTTLIINSVVQGPGNLQKTGPGITQLAATNTYTGSTTIAAGTLQIGFPFGLIGSINAVTIGNNSFETPATNAAAWGYYTGTPSGASWTFGGGSGQQGIANQGSPWFSTAPPDGSQAALLQQAGVISQSVTVSTPGVYLITFSAEGRSGSLGPEGVIVQVDGTPVGTWTASDVSQSQWQNYWAATANLTAGTHTLTFLGNNTLGGDKSVAIDNVQMFQPTGSGLLPLATAVNLNGSGATLDLSGMTQTVGSLAGIAGSLVLNNGSLTAGGDGSTKAFAGVLSGTGSFTKAGSGTLTLSGTNNYTGNTAVNGGTLLVNNTSGSGTGSGALTINAGTTLGGTGSISGAVTNNAGGTLSPGVSGVGTLTLNGNIILKAGSTNTFEVNGNTPTNDQVVAGAAVTYGGLLKIVPTGSFTNGQTFTLFRGAGVTNASQFSSLVATPPVSGTSFTFTNGVLTAAVVAVGPSGPGTIAKSYSGGVLSLSWPAGQGWRLQQQTNSLSTGLSTNWVYLTDGSVSSTNITVNPVQPAVFYRLTYP